MNTQEVKAEYARKGHQKFWDDIYGAAPEGPTAWDLEDEEED